MKSFVIVKAVFRLLALIVLSPAFLLVCFMKYRHFQAAFARSLVAAGMPVDDARQLSQELRISQWFHKNRG